MAYQPFKPSFPYEEVDAGHSEKRLGTPATVATLATNWRSTEDDTEISASSPEHPVKSVKSAKRLDDVLMPQAADSAEAYDAFDGFGSPDSNIGKPTLSEDIGFPTSSPVPGLLSDDFEERAAIVAEGAKVRPAWAEEFARLCVAPRPSRISAKDWQRIVDDGGVFLDRWGSKADELGWGPLDCFGIIKSLDGSNRPLPEIGQRTGLVLLIGGGEVISIAEDRATIRMPSGSTLTYLRRPVLNAVALWDLLVERHSARSA